VPHPPPSSDPRFLISPKTMCSSFLKPKTMCSSFLNLCSCSSFLKLCLWTQSKV
jgi:hypothetical protein